jgi:predicted MFS family arabinose efflux permease
MTVSSWVLEHVAASGLAINALAVGVGISIGIWMYRRWGERWANERRFRIFLIVSHGLVNISLVYLSFVLMEFHKRFTAFIAIALAMMTVAAFMTLKELHRQHQKNNKQPDPGYDA